MNRNPTKRVLKILLALLPIVIGTGVFISISNAAPDVSSPTEAPESHLAVTENSVTYLPVVVNNFPLPPTIFGSEVTVGGANEEVVAQAQTAPLTWIRYNRILWSDVEETKGNYDWSALSTADRDLALLSQPPSIPIAVIRGTPAWAQKVPGMECGPIKEDSLDEFAAFVQAVVKRYSQPPYNVKYWELWNEPDAPFQIPSLGDGPYGCWGDQTDTTGYGGGYYAEMLKVVYPAIKQADPDAKVVLGGLLLDCDPTEDSTCNAGNFLKGVFQNNGQNYVDIIAYHGHPVWNDTGSDWDLTYPKWDHRGGLVLGKLNFIREVMAAYGVSKPIIMNEGGLLCSNTCPESTLRDDQANYVIRFYTRGWAHNLQGVFWFTLNYPGWRNGSLLNADASERPHFQALDFLAETLTGGQYVGQIAGSNPPKPNQLEGYEFRRRGLRYRIYWTNNTSTSVAVSLPGSTQAVYDKYGTVQTTSGSSITVGFDPIIIEYK